MTSITEKKRSWFDQMRSRHEAENFDHGHQSRTAVDMEGAHRQLPPPPVPTSVIEQTALQLNRALEGFTNQETVLVAEITAKTELLRQVRASKLAVSTGLETLDGDPALGGQTAPTDLADQMEAAISEELL